MWIGMCVCSKQHHLCCAMCRCVPHHVSLSTKMRLFGVLFIALFEIWLFTDFPSIRRHWQRQSITWSLKFQLPNKYNLLEHHPWNVGNKLHFSKERNHPKEIGIVSCCFFLSFFFFFFETFNKDILDKSPNERKKPMLKERDIQPKSNTFLVRRIKKSSAICWKLNSQCL